VEQLSDRWGAGPVVEARLRVDQWAGYGLDAERPEELIAQSRGSFEAAGGGVAAEGLPAALRRRVSGLGQKAFKAASELNVPDGTRFIFCSRTGEIDRTTRILTALASGDPVSPADFSLSVHNALAGLLSIAWRNRAGHTTIAAGAETFRAGLIEAASCLMERPEEPVLLVYYDERLPEPYSEFAAAADSCVVLAMLLRPPRSDAGDVTIDLTAEVNPGLRSSSDEARAFLDFLVNGEAPARAGRGEASQWRWRRGQAG
jgi:hypothetical protein